MTFDCMTPEEYTAWLEASARVQYGGKRPCVDCPLWFHLAEKAAGRCNKLRTRTYTDEQLAAKRLEMRARRERLRVVGGGSSAYNGGVGRRDTTANIISDARVSATTRGAGVAVGSRS